ncbi:MAG: hypothetical protein EBR30_02580 [Cytophagia bacterium]|nr:hypothetical protein [Cytophagia bacterium]
MGVDIYGIKPLLTEACPQFPENYDDFSDEEKTAFWDKRKTWEKENPGFYFRNNWWHWRPIQMLIRAFNTSFNIGIPQNELDALGSNDGLGITDPAHCKKLAETFKDLAKEMRKSSETKISVNLGMWYYKTVDKEGRIINQTLVDEDIIQQLDEKYPLSFSGTAEINGIEYTTAHETDIDNLEEFTLFLENCNGFQIY